MSHSSINLMDQLQFMGMKVEEVHNRTAANTRHKKLPGQSNPRIGKNRPNVPVDYYVETKLKVLVNDKYAMYRLRIDYSVINGEYQPRIGEAVNKLLAIAGSDYELVEVKCPGPKDFPSKARHVQLADYAMTLANPASFDSADNLRVALRVALSQQPEKLEVRFRRIPNGNPS